MATLIQQAYLIDPVDPATVSAEGIGDVLIEAGRIVAITPHLTPPDNADLIDAQGQFLGSGLIDLYSQSGEPGNESRETYKSITRAAAAGGFTRIGLLPNTQPAVDSISAIAALHRLNQRDNQLPNQVKIMPWAAITQSAAGEQLTELAELAEAGALGFTDALPLNNSALIRRLLEYAQPLQKPIALWPCDRKLAGGGAAREGPDALRLGLRGVSAIAETAALAALLECVAEIHTPVHIMRVSTARSVSLLRQAKAQGLPVTASVPWHHLVFDTHDLSQYDPSLRHDPPLGTPADRQSLIAGVTEGVIDAIAVDHSAYTYEEKTVAFAAAPPGAIGLELALPVLWQTFVTSGQWSPVDLWHRLSHGPARCLGLIPPYLKVGSPAELTLFDPRIHWQATADCLHSLGRNTPWLGKPVQGKVVSTFND